MADPEESGPLDEQDDPEESNDGVVAVLGFPASEFAGVRDGVIADAMSPGRDAHAAAWRPIGPRNIGGAIRALVQDANRPTRFYAGSAQGGLWRTDDEGLSWKPLGGPQQAFPFGALALAPYDSRILYAGTGEPFQDAGYFAGDGLFLSTDAGETLTRIAPAARAAAGAPPGAADHYTRIRFDPRPVETAGTGRITSAGTAVTGGGDAAGVTTFTNFFVAGDLLRAGDELRVVTAVANDSELTLDRPFSADLANPTAYARATPRIWLACETGLWRFEPGQGFVAAGLPLPGGADPRITDVVLAEDPVAPTHVVLFAGLAGQGHAGAQAGGIFRGVFDRATGNTAWTAALLRRPTGPNPRPVLAAGSFGRVKLAMTAVAPFAVYAVFEDRGAVGAAPQRHPTQVYASDLTGAVWTARGRMYAPTGGQGIAWYALTLAVHPRDPNWLIGGSVGLYTSTDGGTAWQRILDESQFDTSGERGEHADQHDVVFDARDIGQARLPGSPFDHQRIWIANDGGLSSTDRVTTVAPFHGWRKRSNGIVIAQFNALSSHPRFPNVAGGGLQDMGSWVSYGGPTWYYVDGGDGQALAWNPDPAGTTPRVFYASWQGAVDRITVGAAATLAGSRSLRTPLPEVAPPGTVMRAQAQPRALPSPVPFFLRVVACHPTTADHLVVGWQGNARRSTDGTTFNALPTPAFTPATADVRTVAYVPGQASDHFWLGTSGGEVFRTDDATAFTNVTPPWTTAGQPIWRLTMVASGADYRVAVATAGRAGEIFVADVTGAAVNWRRLTGLPATPLIAVAFDPDDPRTLFVGTLAGVYGATDLPAFGLGAGAALAPTWQTYNTGLPLTMVTDLSIVPVTKTLRCATYGRGAFERDLASTPADHRTPAVRLLVRNHVMDDGRAYLGDNSFRGDPRQGAAAGDVDDLRSIDIRVDAPLFRAFETIRFGEPIDGAEFDETLVHDSPVAGDRNVVYVQVQNRGNGTARNVQVHLYGAKVADPAHPPDLQAGFRAAFPGDPPAGAWQRVGPPVTVGEIGPGQPVVVQFDWVPLLDLGANAALLAITTETPDDPLNLGALAPENDVIVTLVRNERRAAARVTPVVANPVYLRDGVDDDGSSGAVAWGGRSPDIVVLAAAPPADVDTNPAFTDLDDPRRGDRVKDGVNPVIVRVHNRSGAAVTADVDLYRVPLDALDRPAAWVRLNAPGTMRTPAIPPRSWRFTAPVTWTVPAADTATTFVLVALVNPVLPAGIGGTPKPDPTTDVSNLATLWRFVRSGALSDKVAMRALRRA